MIRYSKDRVLLLHRYVVEDSGGSPGIRDVGLLEGALESVYATFDGQELYPTKMEKAARLCFNLITSHPFVDGNKRIGVYIMSAFLISNSMNLVYANDEIIDIGMRLAQGSMTYDELLSWVRAHIRT